jgi:hypothetical protein
MRTRLVCSTAVIAIVGAIGAAPVRSADWRGYKFLGTTARCNPSGLVYAHVRVRMIVSNSGVGAHWASNMRVKARLVHPGSGFDFTSSWRTVRYPGKNANPDELLQDHHYAIDFAVNTDVYSADQDWRLQVKLIWDRKAPWHDVVEKFETNFREPECDAVSLG